MKVKWYTRVNNNAAQDYLIMAGERYNEQRCIAVTDEAQTADLITRAINGREDVLALLGNVKHGTETGSRDAKTRGDMLDAIRDILLSVESFKA